MGNKGGKHGKATASQPKPNAQPPAGMPDPNEVVLEEFDDEPVPEDVFIPPQHRQAIVLLAICILC